MAINEGLFPALDAMAEVMVSMEANPKQPIAKPNMNPGGSVIRPPIKSKKTPRVMVPILVRRMELYMIRENTTPIGLANK